MAGTQLPPRRGDQLRELGQTDLTTLGAMPRVVCIGIERPQGNRQELLQRDAGLLDSAHHHRGRARREHTGEIEQNGVEIGNHAGESTDDQAWYRFRRVGTTGRGNMSAQDILDDLVAEQRALDAIVAPLSPEQWALATPSPRWSVADQIGHLTFFDTTAALAIDDSAAFIAHRNDLISKFSSELAVDDATLGKFRQLTAAEQLVSWRQHRDDLEAAGRGLADDTRVEWYGPSMGSKSFLTARLMEAWAHGQDICDTVGVARDATDRLRHIAQLGVITRGWTYVVRGLDVPDTEVRVELAAPSGDTWSWGPDAAPESITGPAEDFCLVVTQRRHVDDTGLAVLGDAARDWMTKAQAFAGGATDGPSPTT